MDIKRKAIKIELEGMEYEFVLDFESAIDFQDIYGKSVFVGLAKISEEQDLKALGCIIASCLKFEGKPVGMEFVNELDLMIGMNFFLDKVQLLIENSLPKKKASSKKK